MLRKPHRPVSVACVCGPAGDDEAFLRLTAEAAAQGPDLIALPEAWQGWDDGPDRAGATERLRALARAHRCYIVHPTIMAGRDGDTNSALLIDRGGEICGRYDKRYPYWGELSQVRPGSARPIMDCDFGRLAIAICFDANFPSVWADAAAQGAELVIWPSAYGAGMQLAAHALNHHFPIVTATLSGHSMLLDIDGRCGARVHADGHFIQWYELDLDRCIFHENFNEDKLAALLAESPRRVEIEKRWPDEQWIIVRSAMAGQSARAACAGAGMEALRHYKQRSRAEIDAMRNS